MTVRRSTCYWSKKCWGNYHLPGFQKRKCVYVLFCNLKMLEILTFLFRYWILLVEFNSTLLNIQTGINDEKWKGNKGFEEEIRDQVFFGLAENQVERRFSKVWNCINCITKQTMLVQRQVGSPNLAWADWEGGPWECYTVTCTKVNFETNFQKS